MLSKGLFKIFHNEKNEEEKYLKLSDYGFNFYKDINERQKVFPKLNTVIREIESMRRSKRMSEKTLSELSGLDIELIKELEYKSKYYYKGRMHFAYIEDIEKIFNCFQLNFNEEIKKLNEKEKMEELEKETRKNLRKNTNNKNSTLKTKNKHIENQHSGYKILISESPIETKLLKEVINLKDTYDFEIDTQVDFSVNGRNYRAEIFIEFKNPKRKILVECDGHDFHEKTKEQVQKDKQRDRDFLSAGIITLRFTGSEIWKNAKGCASEIFNTYNSFKNAISN
jgi:very-short-patch-repair endonuclease